jgi:hypothetical protein
MKAGKQVIYIDES